MTNEFFELPKLEKNNEWTHDTQHNNTQHNDTQHNNTQHNDSQHNTK
jgi:hypothetical protein